MAQLFVLLLALSCAVNIGCNVVPSTTDESNLPSFFGDKKTDEKQPTDESVLDLFKSKANKAAHVAQDAVEDVLNKGDEEAKKLASNIESAVNQITPPLSLISNANEAVDKAGQAVHDAASTLGKAANNIEAAVNQITPSPSLVKAIDIVDLIKEEILKKTDEKSDESSSLKTSPLETSPVQEASSIPEKIGWKLPFSTKEEANPAVDETLPISHKIAQEMPEPTSESKVGDGNKLDGEWDLFGTLGSAVGKVVGATFDYFSADNKTKTEHHNATSSSWPSWISETVGEHHFPSDLAWSSEEDVKKTSQPKREQTFDFKISGEDEKVSSTTQPPPTSEKTKPVTEIQTKNLALLVLPALTKPVTEVDVPIPSPSTDNKPTETSAPITNAATGKHELGFTLAFTAILVLFV